MWFAKEFPCSGVFGRLNGQFEGPARTRASWRRAAESQHPGLCAARYRLPGSRQEVIAAEQSLGHPDRSVALLGPDATESKFKSQPLGNFRILHFAVHGLSDPQFPDRAALVWGATPRPGVKWHRHSCLCLTEQCISPGHRQECLCHFGRLGDAFSLQYGKRKARRRRGNRWTGGGLLACRRQKCGRSAVGC